MTILNKPIRRELPGSFDRRLWTVVLHGWGIEFRAKRSRRTFPITWDSVFNRCMMIAAEQARKERLEKRKQKRGTTNGS